jgi:hypothetical protein
MCARSQERFEVCLITYFVLVNNIRQAFLVSRWISGKVLCLSLVYDVTAPRACRVE